MDVTKATTAVICIVGDEILTGQTHDTNGHYMARRLYEIGVAVERYTVLPDRLEPLAAFLRKWARRSDYVFTSGGIGPTHDDITREAVALALGRPLVVHPEAEALIRAYYGDLLNEARLSMALLPENAEIIPNPESGVPGCVSENIFVLPGIPRILEPMFESVVHRLHGMPPTHFEIPTSIYEGQYAEALTGLCRRFPEVHVGSYPRLGNPHVRSVITLASADPAAATRMRAEVERMLDAIARSQGA